MNETTPILLVGLLSVALAGIICITLATFLFDLRLLKLQKQIAAVKPHRYKKLAVIIYAHNSASVIEYCLESLSKTKLRSLEVVVVDNGSGDDTVRKIKQFQTLQPGFQLITLYKKRTSSKAQAVRQAATKIHRSDIVLTVEANACLSKKLLNTLRAFPVVAKEAVPIQLPGIQLIYPNYLSVAHGYFELSEYLIEKATSFLGLSMKPKQSRAVYFPALEVLRQQISPRIQDLSYLSRVKYFFHSNQPRFSFKVILVSSGIVILFSYLLYLAVFQVVWAPLFYSAGILIIWLGLVIFSVPYLERAEKTTAISVLPAAYLLLYVISFSTLFKAPSALKTKLTISIDN